MKGFKEFILRGNVIDLAVAVVIGTAFTAIVTAIVDAVINPLIGAVFDASTLAEALPVTIPTTSGSEATLYFGAVLAAIINFAIVAAVVYFVLVLPVNALLARTKKEAAAEDAGPTEAELLVEIRDLLAAERR